MAVIERTSRRVVVSLAPRRWDRLMELEKAYEIARAVVRAKKECETAPTLSVSNAYNAIDFL